MSVQDLSERKRALLERLRSGGQQAGEQLIPRLEPGVPHELSSAQQRILFVEQLYPQACFNGTLVLEHDGDLDAARLAQALRTVVGRHDILRTRAVATPEGPRGLVGPVQDARLDQADVSGEPGHLRSAAALRHARDAAQQRIDVFTDNPLVRALTIRMSTEQTLLVLTFSPFAFDATTGVVFASEMIAAYQDLSAGRTPQAAAPALQYADYVAWARRDTSRDAAQSLDYWTARLAGQDQDLQLPTERARTGDPSMLAIRHPFVVPAAQAQALKALAKAQGASFYMLLLAALQILLFRHAPQSSVAVGAWTLRRTPRTAQMLGPMVNTLVHRAQLSDDDTLADVIRKAREGAGGSLAHGDAPFEDVVAAIAPLRDMRINPLFQVHFILQETGASAEIGGFRLSPLDAHVGAAGGYDVELIVRDLERGVEGHFECSAQLFDAASAARLERRYLDVLAALASDPGRRVGEVAFSDPAPVAAPPPAPCPDLDRLLIGFASADASRTAVRAGDASTTYGELRRRVDLMRARIEACGPNTVVGLACGAGADMCAGMLAALQTRAPFVALGPLPDPARLQRLAAEGRLLLLPGDADGAEPGPAFDGDARASAGDTAYLAFSSGSTGEPTLVRTSRDALATHLSGVGRLFRLGPASVVLAWADPTFDVAIEEALPTLLAGGEVVVADLDGGLADLTAQGRRHGVTVMNLSSSLWRRWFRALEDAGEAPPDSLELLVIGSEPVEISRVVQWREAFGRRVRLLHAYGLTEAAITSSVYEAPDDLATLRALPRLPIGRPLPGVDLAPVDRAGAPAPPLVVGELCVSGPGVGPATGLPADRLFHRDGRWWLRTGDLGRLRPDGELEILGRTSRALKVRGRMLAPEPFEQAARGHEGVAAARVEVVGQDDHLRSVLRVWPRQSWRTPEGRRALRNDLAELTKPASASAAPLDRIEIVGEAPAAAAPLAFSPDALGEMERRLLDLWRKASGLDALGLDEDIFALGITSLDGLHFISAARRTGATLAMADIYEAPTIRGQAARAMGTPS